LRNQDLEKKTAAI
jgi:hypothetical protein